MAARRTHDSGSKTVLEIGRGDLHRAGQPNETKGREALLPANLQRVDGGGENSARSSEGADGKPAPLAYLSESLPQIGNRAGGVDAHSATVRISVRERKGHVYGIKDARESTEFRTDPEMSKRPTRPSVLGENLARIMRERGLGATELKDLCGMSHRSTITGLLSGASPGSVTTAEELAAGLGIHITELLGAPPRIAIDMDRVIERWKASDEAMLVGPLTAKEEAELRLRAPSVFTKEPTMRGVSLLVATIREDSR